MTYGELKRRMIDFGFEESDYLSDPMAESEFRSSVNQARQTIAQYFPTIGRYDFAQDGTAVGLHKINLKDKTENNTDGETVSITFDGIYDNFDSMQIIQDGKVNPFGDYTIEQGNIIVLSYAIKGSFTIFFEKGITLIGEDTQDEFDIEIAPEYEHLVPLLASYHAWLDDDIQKATMYYNEYEQERNSLQAKLNEQKNKAKARVVGGIRWH